jgi:hypothetical protein
MGILLFPWSINFMGDDQMICRNCGRVNDADKRYCSYCNCILSTPRAIPDAADINSYESEDGFSRPDSQYIEPQIINLEEIESNEYSQPNNDRNVQLKIIDKKLGLKQPHRENEIYEDLQQEFPQELYREQESQKQNKFTNRIKLTRKSLIGMSIAFLLIIFFILFLDRVLEDGAFSFIDKDSLEVYIDRTKSDTYVFNSNGDLLHKIAQSVTPYYTKDHTAALLVSHNNAQSHYVNAQELIKLNPGMRSYSMSENGKYIVYSTFNGLQNFYLNLYDVDNHSEKVIDTITGKQYDMIQTSPEGKIINYITVSYPFNMDYMEYESIRLKLGNGPETLGKNIIVFEVSKDNKYIYYIDRTEETSNSIYVKSDTGTVLLSNNVTNNIFFNKDATEIIISEGERTYISVNGGERQQIADTIVSKIVTPRKSVIYSKYNMGIYSYGFTTFKNKVILCNNALKLIDNQFQSKDIGYVTNNQQIVISKDGTDLIYRNADRDLMRVNNLDGTWEQDKIAAAIDDSIASSNDLSKIYYLMDNQLYYLFKQKEPLLITDDASNLCINQAGDTAYVLKNNSSGSAMVYYCVNGGKLEVVPESEGVIGLKEWNFGIIYQKRIDGRNAVFYNSKGTKFNLLVDGVDFFQQDVQYTQ